MHTQIRKVNGKSIVGKTIEAIVAFDQCRNAVILDNGDYILFEAITEPCQWCGLGEFPALLMGGELRHGELFEIGIEGWEEGGEDKEAGHESV